MKTVGLDFGTHQSKICVETKNGAELSYEFFKFRDAKGAEHYTLPSIIHVDEGGLLSYGYLPDRKMAETVRYFKQATFTNAANGMDFDRAVVYSIWYIAFILFELQERFGQDFSIQMGVPSDGAALKERRKKAVRLLLSAFRLVEEVFKNDKERFLATPVGRLTELTEFVAYDKEKKDLYGLLVFPEAYACLMPLVQASKITYGMSLMVDIGGGTTDISFFNINSKKNMPQIYAFYSIEKGLNYLTDADSRDDFREDSNVRSAAEILKPRRKAFKKRIDKICENIERDLYREFSVQCSQIPVWRLHDAIKVRPLVYSGGGSTFGVLRTPHAGFSDIVCVSAKQWQTAAVKEMETIEALGLCPILSTAYGLSKGVADDDIKCMPFRDIFEHIRKVGADFPGHGSSGVAGRRWAVHADHDFSPYDDWDAIK